MKPKIVNYTSLTPYKISEIVSLLIEKNKSDFTEAIEYLYLSKLYKHLSDESTKLWHLSAEKLFDLLENEKKHGNFQFPDFV